MTATVVGCGPDLAGSAAVVGPTRITDEQLTTEVDAVTEKLGIETSNRANQVVLDRMIRGELYNTLADRNGIVISQGDLDSFLADAAKQVGGEQALADQLIQSGVPADAIASFARTFLQQQALANKLAPGKTTQEQGTLLGLEAIALSKALDIRVSPRFGSWEAARLSVGPVPDDLSAPLPNGNSELMQVPVPQQQ